MFSFFLEVGGAEGLDRHLKRTRGPISGKFGSILTDRRRAMAKTLQKHNDKKKQRLQKCEGLEVLHDHIFH